MKKLIFLTLILTLNLFAADPNQFSSGIKTKLVQYYTAKDLTISGGQITITSGNNTIDTEASSATDDLVTINVSGITANTTVQFKQANTSRVVVFKNGTGNIITGSSDFSLQDGLIATFFYDGTNFVLSSGGGSSSLYNINRALVSNSAGAISVSTTTDTEIGYISGLTSSAQSQINGKEPTITTLSHEKGGLEADVSAYDGILKISAGSTSAVTAPAGTIVGTSDTQTLTNKTLTAPVINVGSDVDGDIYYRASGLLARLPKGTAGQALFMNGGATAPEWGTAGTVSPLTTKGDIFTYSTDNARLAVGTDGQRLIADSSEVTGLKWDTIPVTEYKDIVTTGDARWAGNKLSLTHGITGSIPADELVKQFTGITTPGSTWTPKLDATSTTSIAVYDFTDCGKPGESVKAVLLSAGGAGSGTGTDTSALHVNVANEITAITAITALADGDEFVIEDASASYTKKAITASNIKKYTDLQGINSQTGTTYTLVLTDEAKNVTMSNSSANVLTIPANSAVAFDVGTVIVVTMLNTGTTTITADTGVTLNGVSAGSGAISGQYKAVFIQKIGTDTWLVVGAIGTVA